MPPLEEARYAADRIPGATLKVLGIAMVTNFAAGLGTEPLTHTQTMRAAAASIVPLTRVLVKLFENGVPERRT